MIQSISKQEYVHYTPLWFVMESLFKCKVLLQESCPNVEILASKTGEKSVSFIASLEKVDSYISRYRIHLELKKKEGLTSLNSFRYLKETSLKTFRTRLYECLLDSLFTRLRSQ